MKLSPPYVYTTNAHGDGRQKISDTMTMIYWHGEKFRLGKLLEHPEIMSQEETIQELQANIKEACRLMAMDDVPEEHRVTIRRKTGRK